MPGWARPAGAFRPTTQEFSQAAENIAFINYRAFQRAKKMELKNDSTWRHYVDTKPQKKRKLIEFTRAPKLPPVPNQSGLEFKESWLEPIRDETENDADFEQRTRHDGPKVRLLKRVLRNKQKNHDALIFSSRDHPYSSLRTSSSLSPCARFSRLWLRNFQDGCQVKVLHPPNPSPFRHL